MIQLFFKQIAIMIYKKEYKNLLVFKSGQQTQLTVSRMMKTIGQRCHR